MVLTLHGLALAFYLGGTAGLAAALARGLASVPRWCTALVVAGVAWHGAGLATYARVYGELPLVGIAPSLSSVGFLIGVLAVGVAGSRDSRPIGLVLVPLVALLVGAAAGLGLTPAAEELTFRGAWFALHVVLGFLACAGLAVAFAAGLLYLLQFRELKGKRFGRMFRFFPSLGTLDRLGRRALGIGFSALSAALLLGWAWTVRFRRSFAVSDPEVIWGLLTWVVFACALAARRGGVERDRRGALASVIGFVVVVVAYLALRLSMAEGWAFL
ncbi:MAG TPA: cytochrome c biogenesis protein CcsA [Longimicrobiales bacterium]